MSTRATYRFFNSKDKFTPDVTIYKHHDGYVEGAASWFLNLVFFPSNESVGRPYGDLGTRFLRANPHSFITPSHDVHGDTEYRYDVDENDIHGETRGETARLKVFDIYENKVIYDGYLWPFIVENANPHWCEPFVAEYGPAIWETIKHAVASTFESDNKQLVLDSGPLILPQI